MNLVDFVIIFLVGLAVFDGWRAGFLLLLVDLVAFVVGSVLAFSFATPVGELLSHWLSISVGLRPFFGFAVLFLVTTIGLRLAMRSLQAKLVVIVPLANTTNKLAGACLNFIKQLFALAIALNILLFLPVIPFVRKQIQTSRLAPYFIINKAVAEELIARVVAPAVYETQDFLTTKTISDKSVKLDTPVGHLIDDREAERTMYFAVNKERTDRGLLPLTWNEQLAQVARLNSRDMWRRQYFAHINPDGADPFARLHQANIGYLTAGENLAMAPSTPIAHQGLMDSPEHKDNILSPDYGQIGIGIVRNGLYGAMFSQEFTN
jgi:uncharacterized protein YkwD